VQTTALKNPTKTRNTFSLEEEDEKKRQKVPSSFFFRPFFLARCIKEAHKNERLLYARGGVTRHERARESEDQQRVDIIFNSKKKH
jgi:hypothetical protein|tara:strand:+ start:109 stop:366 length:258 start_codon:yes stop_codon:yes gene_type:complete